MANSDKKNNARILLADYVTLGDIIGEKRGIGLYFLTLLTSALGSNSNLTLSS